MGIVALGAIGIASALAQSALGERAGRVSRKARKKARRADLAQRSRALKGLGQQEAEVVDIFGQAGQADIIEAQGRSSSERVRQKEQLDIARRRRLATIGRAREDIVAGGELATALSRLQDRLGSINVLQQQISAFTQSGLIGLAAAPRSPS